MRSLLCAAAALALGGCSTYLPQRYSRAADTNVAPPAAAAVVATSASPEAAVKAVTPVGYVQKFLYQAEHLPEVLACGARSQVTLTGVSTGLELYSAMCSNGDMLRLRCQWGACRVLK